MENNRGNSRQSIGRRPTSVIIALLLLLSGAGLRGLAGTDLFAPRRAQAAVLSLASGKVVAPHQAASPSEAVGNGFTYQGQLKDGGATANGQYDLEFTLFDALTGGGVVGAPVTLTNRAVTNGLFTEMLDFGPGAFDGNA